MVAAVVVLLNPYALAAAAVGVGAIELGLVKREDLAQAADTALRYSAELSLKAAPWVIAGLTGVKVHPLWRPSTITQMSNDAIPQAADVPAPTIPSTPAAPPPPDKGPGNWREALRRTIDRVSGPVSGAMEFVRNRWYLRWAPLPLSLAYAIGNATYVEHQQETERLALRKPVPDKLRELVKNSSPSLVDAITIVHNFAYDAALMQDIIPKMFRTAYTPDGTLVVVHALLETFSLHPAVSPEMKQAVLRLIEREFDGNAPETTIKRFAAQMAILKEDLATPNMLISVESTVVSGHVMQPGIANILSDMRDERNGLLAMAAEHDQWMHTLGLPNTILQQTHARVQAIDHRLNLEWGVVQSKLQDPERYMAAVTEGFKIMTQDFRQKNRSIMDMMEDGTSTGDSMESIVGLFWGMTVFKSPWSYLTSMLFMGVGSKVSESNTAVEQSRLHRPVKFCLPDYGTNCDTL